MTREDRKYIFLVGAHVLLGFLIYVTLAFSKIYGIGIFAVGLWQIVKNRNEHNEALLWSAYVVGAEVLLRMTGGNFVNEYGKYVSMIFMIVGIYYQGFSRAGTPYWIFLLLLLPGIIVSTQAIGGTDEIKKAISFNISGPLCLGVCALYCYSRRIALADVYEIVLRMGLPTIVTASYLTFFTPDLRASITGTGSNFVTSGMFGPNQVSTSLGLGMFVFFSRIVLNSPSRLIVLVNLFLSLNLAFRGLITFSRGGMITGALCLCTVMLFTYLRVNGSGRSKLRLAFIGSFFVFFGIWAYSSVVTGGLLEKRYTNEDARGRKKQSNFSGREDIASDELNNFEENPVFGIGVGGSTRKRVEAGIDVASHSEITRMLSEHGAFGILGLLILLFTPLILYAQNKEHIFLICFLLFWIMTINHAAMRTAAPSFVYALSLLKITGYDRQPSAVHRQ